MNRAERATWPCRSQLAVPGSDPRKIAKGLASQADLVFLDLEDAVAADAKEAARREVVEALRTADWQGRPKVVRINAIDSPHCFRDLIAVAELGEESADRIVVPKVREVGDLAFLDRLLGQVEAAAGRAHPIGLEIQIEDPTGVIHAAALATASSRVEAVTFGPGDFAASAGMPAGAIGVRDEWDAAYGADRWHLARQTVVLAARAAGALPLDGPYAAYRDLDGFRAYCRRARALGLDGVWCIHPEQIAVANDVFTPSATEIAAAERVLAALERAGAAGHGAAIEGGAMVDAASERMARQTLARARRSSFRDAREG